MDLAGLLRGQQLRGLKVHSRPQLGFGRGRKSPQSLSEVPGAVPARVSRALRPAGPALSAVRALTCHLSPATSLRVVSSPPQGHGGTAPPGFCVQLCGSAGRAPGAEGEPRERAEPTGAHLPGAAGPRWTDSALPMGGRSGAGKGREGPCGAVRAAGHARAPLSPRFEAAAPPRPEPAPPTAAAGGTRAERTGTGSALIGLERFEPSRARFGRVGWAQPEPVQPLSSRPGAIPKVPIPARILCPHQPGTLE